MARTGSSLDWLCIQTLRLLAVDAVEEAKSGHPGLPLGAAPMAYVLWQRHLRHNPRDPLWCDRDRFVLSAGHGSALLYSLLHLTGYDLPLEQIRAFRRWGSRTPGHPERGLAPGVEVTTGPLGQGAGNSVGMAIAERSLAHRFNRPDYPIIDHRIYALVSDGDLMEGVAAEAVSLAGHLGLGRLIWLYDANAVSLDGPTSIAFTEDVGRRFGACGWQVLEVPDGDHDLAAIDSALAAARVETERPSLVIVRTTIGYGAPHKQGTCDAHGSPLGPEETALTKKALGFDPAGRYSVPEEAAARLRSAVDRGAELQGAWEENRRAWAREYPGLAGELERSLRGDLPEEWDRDLPRWSPGNAIATREAAGIALQTLAERIPEMIGGDADLSSSTKTTIAAGGSFDGRTGIGRNLHFGVREHAMGAIANGIAAHGGERVFVSTFFCFSDYMRPAVRLASLSELPVIYVWTHDSIGLGEDGPTHQPVEHLMSLRAMPGLWIVRPCDGNETAEAWRLALARRDGPTALVLTRQKLPVLDRGRLAPASGARRGAYALADPPSGAPQAILIATGSEVHPALEAHDILAREGIATRVVSMPCWELFEAQEASYREAVLPRSVRARVAIEAGASLGWWRWVGENGAVVACDRFGASAPGEVVLERLGFTADRIAGEVRRLLERDR